MASKSTANLPAEQRVLRERDLQNIIALVPVESTAQPMIKKILLPGNIMRAGKPSFPLANDLRDGRHIGKTHDQVNVIRHEDGEIAIPNALIVPMFDRFQDNWTDLRPAKMISSLGLGANRHEIISLGTDPFGSMMLQFSARGPFHFRSLDLIDQNAVATARRHPR